MASGLHPQVQSILDAGAATRDDAVAPDLEALRAGYLKTAIELGGAVEEVGRVEDVVVPRGEARIPGRAYWPRVPAEGRAGALVWFHGGGWCLGDLEGFDRVCRSLANAAGHAVVSVDYRLAPEHPYPAAVDDAVAALRWARGEGAAELGADPERIAVGGDSAGGQIAAEAALAARDDGLPELRAQLLVYPALDPSMGSEAYREFCDGPLLTATEMQFCWGAYLGGVDGYPGVLGREDLAGAPPALIAVAGHDPLRDDGIAFAAALRAAGVETHVEVYEDMAHGFLRWGGVVDRAHELITALGERARAALA